MAKQVLVTGANGFLGSVLCRKLVERGDHVRAVIRPTSDLTLLDGVDVEFVHGDLANDGVPQAAMRGVETVYHVAAAFRKEGLPERYFFKVNADATEELLTRAIRADVVRFVHCSTGGVHGHIETPPASETAPFRPHDHYQRSKLDGERRAVRLFEAGAISGVAIRPASIYGPGDLRYLKLYRAIDRGVFWMIGDGRAFHHPVYVDDLVDGMMLAEAHTECNGEAFILGGAEYVSVKELVARIAKVLGKPLPTRHLPLKPVALAAELCQRLCVPLGIEPPIFPRRLDFFTKDRAFDISKARTLLGYQPQVDLTTGLSTTALWYRQHGYL